MESGGPWSRRISTQPLPKDTAVYSHVMFVSVFACDWILAGSWKHRDGVVSEVAICHDTAANGSRLIVSIDHRGRKSGAFLLEVSNSSI